MTLQAKPMPRFVAVTIPRAPDPLVLAPVKNAARTRGSPGAGPTRVLCAACSQRNLRSLPRHAAWLAPCTAGPTF